MAALPILSPRGGWPMDDGLPCCGCGVLRVPDEDVVQVDFADRTLMLFCGFKCLALWAQHFSTHVELVRAWTALVEPHHAPPVPRAV